MSRSTWQRFSFCQTLLCFSGILNVSKTKHIMLTEWPSNTQNTWILQLVWQEKWNLSADQHFLQNLICWFKTMQQPMEVWRLASFVSVSFLPRSHGGTPEIDFSQIFKGMSQFPAFKNSKSDICMATACLELIQYYR